MTVVEDLCKWQKPPTPRSVFLVAVCVLAFISVYSIFVIPSHSAQGEVRDVRKCVILLWTKYYSDEFGPDLRIYHEIARDLTKCTHQCTFVSNRSLFNESTAVVFSAPDISVTDLPAFRFKWQYFVYFNLESPVHTKHYRELETYFNLSLTYKWDSDVIVDSYFQHYHPTIWSYEDDAKSNFVEKSRVSMSLISNCNAPSGRDTYVRQLSKVFPVEMYGKCAQLECGTDDDCATVLRTYKFFLAFENSLCKDYVTEKVYRALSADVVPVVFGAANYGASLPPHSFIDARQFPSPQELGKYLLSLISNTTAYMQYFAWKFSPEYAILPDRFRHPNIGWCRLCTLLAEADPSRSRIVNLTEFWSPRLDCSVGWTEVR